MSAISQKSITGITSITTPAGVDNQLTLHNNNTTEAVKLDTAGNLHFHNHLNITGISTASNFKTGTSNLHNTGLNVFDLDVDGHTNLDNVSIAGVASVTSNLIVGSLLTASGGDINGDLDVDGHTNLDNVSIAGFTTFSQNINVLGSMTGQSVVLNAGSPTIFLNDTDTDSDFSIQCNGGLLKFMDTTNSYAVRLAINSSGNVEVKYDLDVDGHTNLDNVNIVGVTTTTSNIEIKGNNKYLKLGASDQFAFVTVGSQSFITDSTGRITQRSASYTWENYAGNTEYLRIASNGRVGINTDNPQTTLYSMNEIAAGDGNRQFIGMQAKTVDGIPVGEIRTTYYSGASGAYPHMRFVTSDNERLRIKADGSTFLQTSNVNINRGTSGAGVPLTVRGPSSGYVLRLERAGSGQWHFGFDGNTHFQIFSNTTNVLQIDNDGKVGINETSPDSLLHLTTDNSGAYSTSTTNTVNATNALLRLENINGSDGSGVNNYVGMYFRVGSGANSDSQLQYVRTGDNQGAFHFKARNAGSTYPNLMTIKSDGNIGINQTTPTRARLHVAGPSSSGTEIVAKFKGASGNDARTKIGLVAAYSDTANDTEGHAYVGALRNGSGNSSQLFFEISHGNALKELARVDNNGINVGGSYRFNNGARDSATMPNTHNIGDVSSNTISYQHNAGFYYVYATIPTDGNWYDMFTSINDSACNFRGVCGDASSKNSFYWYFNPTSPSYGVNPYGEKWHHGSWNTGSVTFRLDGSHPNWNLQIKCTSYYGTNRTASLRAVMEVYY